MNKCPMRAYIRHPSDIPITITSATGSWPRDTHALRNISFGGLSCAFGMYLKPGTLISLHIPFIKPAFEAQGKVVWCHSRAHGYDLGVAFMNADEAFRMRMVEQICHIEHYRYQMWISEGRELSAEQAARDWIRRFAADFPNPEPAGSAEGDDA